MTFSASWVKWAEFSHSSDQSEAPDGDAPEQPPGWGGPAPLKQAPRARRPISARDPDAPPCLRSRAAMQLSAQESRRALFFFFCVLLRSCHTYKNDATERLFTHAGAPVPLMELQSNASLNRARAGGRGAGGSAHDRAGKLDSSVGAKDPLWSKMICWDADHERVISLRERKRAGPPK